MRSATLTMHYAPEQSAVLRAGHAPLSCGWPIEAPALGPRNRPGQCFPYGTATVEQVHTRRFLCIFFPLPPTLVAAIINAFRQRPSKPQPEETSIRLAASAGSPARRGRFMRNRFCDHCREGMGGGLGSRENSPMVSIVPNPSIRQPNPLICRNFLLTTS